MIDVRVKLFGPLKDIAAADEVALSLPPPCMGEGAFEALVEKFPEMGKWRSSVRLAVNLEYTSFGHELKNGDEVCFIPPVSGG